MKETNACAMPNYEAEFHRMCEVCEKLTIENNRLRQEYDSMETEFIRMRAQLDIIHLIFGGK